MNVGIHTVGANLNALLKPTGAFAQAMLEAHLLGGTLPSAVETALKLGWEGERPEVEWTAMMMQGERHLIAAVLLHDDQGHIVRRAVTVYFDEYRLNNRSHRRDHPGTPMFDTRETEPPNIVIHVDVGYIPLGLFVSDEIISGVML